VAKELNDINKDITTAIDKLKKVDSIELSQANLASEAAKGLQGVLKTISIFIMDMILCLHGGFLKHILLQTACSAFFQVPLKEKVK
jgi:hypothetical protein